MSTLKLGNIGSLVTYDSSIQKMVSHKDIEIVIGNDKIIDIGTKLDHADSFIDCRQKLVTPGFVDRHTCLLYTSPSPRDRSLSRMPSSA